MTARRTKARKGCPYKVTITCDLTPPYDFIRETQHRSYETAMKAARAAKKELKGTPGLKIEVSKEGASRKTSWERILAV